MGKRDSEIAIRIKQIRQSRGMTQKQLAQKLGVSQTAIALWESGTRGISLDLIDELADILGISASYLLLGEEDINDHNIINTHNKKDDFKNDDRYYFNDETHQIAQDIFENPQLYSLFKVARDIPPEHLRAYIEFMKSLKEQEQESNDEQQ